MARKYYSQWVNAEGDSCQLDFYFASYSGAATELSSGMRAFVLKEFNSDNDFYKPIRPQQAEFEILADGVTLESFLFNNDNEVSIQFLWNGNVYWRGWLIQDDFEESWVDSKHFITLRATEQLSGLNIIAPTLPVGHSTPLDFILNAISTTSINNAANRGLRVLNNFFYETMDDKAEINTATCLDQMFISNATFQRTLTTFDDYQTILEKINTSFNQTIFQYNGAAYLMRMSEFLTYTNDLPGIEYRPLLIPSVISTSENYIAEIGIDEDIKPIMPEMLRQVVRPYKKFQIDFKNEFPPEILCNESFFQGTLISSTSTLKLYTIDSWGYFKGLKESPTVATSEYGRKVELTVDNEIIDNCAYFIPTVGDFNQYWLQSCDILVRAGGFIEITFDTSVLTTAAFSNYAVAQVLLLADAGGLGSLRYGLNNDGQWILSPTNFDNAVIPFITGSMDSGSGVRYFSINIKSNSIPYNGIIKVLLLKKPTENAGYEKRYKNITFNISTLINGRNDVKVIGDYDRYTKSEDIKNNFQQQTFLDDVENPYWKGAIFSPDNVLTGDNWYRMQYLDERFTFKRQKAIAHWLLNRRYRQLITGNFYGLTWSNRERPIGLLNRFVFTEDAPTKQFMIVNLQEIDFVSCQWKATLLETYDSTIDTSFTDYPPHSFDFLYSE